MSTHTPAPWRQLVSRIDDARGYQICHLDLHGKTEGERDANRRLIAAAPELLAELQRCFEREHNPFEPDNQSAAYHRMKALIAKATGEVQ